MSLREALRDRRPVALATVIDGPHLGAKLLVEPHRPPIGTLGDPDLDRVVARDMAGELAAGRTGVRHYGPQGQANDERLQVFIESYAQPPRDADLRCGRLHRRAVPGGERARLSGHGV